MSYLKGLADKVNNLDAKDNFKLFEIDIDKLIPSSKNFYGIREIEELAESIREDGLMHNLVVRKIDEDRYEILSGERRYHALKKLNYKKVPCQVRNNVNDLDAELILIQANSEQRELTPSEKMEGIKRLKEIYEQKRGNGEKLQGKTRDLIGKTLGMSGVQVGRYQKVDNKLTNEFRDMLDKNEITLTQAVDLSNLSEREQTEIYENIKGIPNESKEEIKILIDGIKQPVENKKDEEFIEEIKNKNSTVVETIQSETKEETIVIEDASLDKQLERLLEHDPKPKLIVSIAGIEGILKIKNIKITGNNSEVHLTIELFDSSFLEIPLSSLEIADPDTLPLKLKPKKAYRIHIGVFLWFKNRE